MRRIRVTTEVYDTILQQFISYLQKHKGNKIKFEASLDDVNPKDYIIPTVEITADAYLKQLALISNNTGEVGWHGTVEKIDDCTYRITNILVYPQTVSAAKVTVDEKGYGEWLIKELPDEIFNKLRYQAHSHVNMTCSPSGLDDQTYDGILQTLHDDDYYIFAIWNKKNELNMWVYDFKQGVIFDNKDILFRIILPDNTSLNTWTKQQETHITEAKAYVSYTNKNYWADDETDMYWRGGYKK
jgi:hypothetical protein